MLHYYSAMYTEAGDPMRIPLISLQKRSLNSKQLDSKQNLEMFRIFKSKLELELVIYANYKEIKKCRMTPILLSSIELVLSSFDQTNQHKLHTEISKKLLNFKTVIKSNCA